MVLLLPFILFIYFFSITSMDAPHVQIVPTMQAQHKDQVSLAHIPADLHRIFLLKIRDGNPETLVKTVKNAKRVCRKWHVLLNENDLQAKFIAILTDLISAQKDTEYEELMAIGKHLIPRSMYEWNIPLRAECLWYGPTVREKLHAIKDNNTRVGDSIQLWTILYCKAYSLIPQINWPVVRARVIENGFIASEGMSPIMYAVHCKDEKLFQALIPYARWTEILHEDPFFGNTFHVAAETNNPEIIKALAKKAEQESLGMILNHENPFDGKNYKN